MAAQAHVDREQREWKQKLQEREKEREERERKQRERALAVQKNNEELLEELQEGDMIECPRGLFSHWALYIGDGRVIHLTDIEAGEQAGSGLLPSISSSSGSLKARVRESSFWEVVADSFAKKNNEKDNEYPPLAKSEIVQTAKSSLGRTGYNLWSDNCEHFVAECRYGVKKSDQVDKVVKGLTDVVIAVVVYGLSKLFGLKKKEKE